LLLVYNKGDLVRAPVKPYWVYAYGVKLPLYGLLSCLILQSVNEVKAMLLGNGNFDDWTGTSYMMGKPPGADEILNLGINSKWTWVILYVMNRVDVSDIGKIDRVGKISILKNVVADGTDTEFDKTD